MSFNLKTKKYFFSSKRHGQSLIEVLIAMAIFTFTVSSIISLILGVFGSNQQGKRLVEATALAQEGVEAARSIRDVNWLNLTAGGHGLQNSSGYWEFNGIQDTIGKFKRTVSVEDVYRDSGGNIVATGGTIDRRTKKVVSNVRWAITLTQDSDIDFVSYLTDWRTLDWTQTTNDDFNTGKFIGTKVVDVGVPADVRLDLTQKWALGNAATWIQTTDTDFNAGGKESFINTEANGSGVAADVKLKQQNQWALYSQSNYKYWSQTTDTDWNAGTSNTIKIMSTGAESYLRLDSNLQWIERMDSPTSRALYGIHMVSSTDGWAVGDNGEIIRWDGNYWYRVASPTNNHLRSVYMLAGDNGWAVGNSGTIIHWDGTSWSNYSPSPVTNHLNDVYMVSANDGWAVGESGKILRYQNGAWEELQDTGNDTWSSVHMVSASDGWMAGNSGKIYHWTGSPKWNLFQDTGGETWNSIYMLSATDGWAAGSGGAIRHFVGGDWTPVTSQTINDLYGIQAMDSTSGWAVGAGGTIIKWNGVEWAPVSSPTSKALRGIYFISSGDGWTTGDNGAIIRYGDLYNTSGTFTSQVFDSGLDGTVWDYISWSHLLPGGTNLTMATRTGNTPSPDGSWSSWSVERSNPDGSSIISPVSRYIQFRATFSSNTGLNTPYLYDTTITYHPLAPTTSHMRDIQLVSPTDGWAVGDGGTIIRWDGNSWQSVSSPPGTNALNSVYTLSANAAWAVGDGGTIIYWNGSNWSPVDSPTGNTLSGIFMVSATEGWAVGDKGTIVHCVDNNWSVFPSSPTSNALNNVYMLSANEGWAVGAGGTIIHFENGSWSPVDSRTGNFLRNVHMVSASDGWAVGNNGTIVQWNGSEWSVFPSSPTSAHLYGVSLSSTDSGWAMGDNGTIINWDGKDWTISPSPTTTHIHNVFMFSAADGWAVGNGGLIIKLGYQHYLQGTFVSQVFDSGSAGTGWDVLKWMETLPAGTEITLATHSGPTAAPDGSWSSWSSETSNATGMDITSPDNRYFQFRATFTTTNTSASPLLHEVTVDFHAPSPTMNDLKDVQMLSATDGWAVGNSGTILRWNGLSWSNFTSPPTTSNLNSIDLVSATDGWAVGAGGRIIRLIGSSWSIFTPSPTTETLYGIDMISSTDGYAVGANGKILHWNGSSWSLSTQGSGTWYSVHMVSSTEGWAVGSGGAIRHWNGSNWSPKSSPTTANLKGLYMLSANEGWAVGAGGVIIKYNGSQWSQAYSPTTDNLNSVYILYSTNGWATADGGKIIHLVGTIWENYDPIVSVTENLNSVGMISSSDGFIVGNSGRILRYKENFNTWGTYTSVVFDSNCAPAYWKNLYWVEELPIGTDITIATHSGNSLTPDPTWSDWTSEMTTPEGETISSPANRYFQYRAILSTTVSENPVTPILEEVVVTFTD